MRRCFFFFVFFIKGPFSSFFFPTLLFVAKRNTFSSHPIFSIMSGERCNDGTNLPPPLNCGSRCSSAALIKQDVRNRGPPRVGDPLVKKCLEGLNGVGRHFICLLRVAAGPDGSPSVKVFCLCDGRRPSDETVALTLLFLIRRGRRTPSGIPRLTVTTLLG